MTESSRDWTPSYKAELLHVIRRAKELRQKGLKQDTKFRPIRAALRANIALQNTENQLREVES